MFKIENSFLNLALSTAKTGQSKTKWVASRTSPPQLEKKRPVQLLSLK